MRLAKRVMDPVGSLVDELIRHVPKGKCDAVLDVGCGAGDVARRLSKRATRVVAVDRAEHMIELARARSVDFPNVQFVCDDFLNTQLAPSSFDFVISLAAVHHMDFEAALTKMRTVTRPGGVVAILGLGREASFQDYAVSAAGVMQRQTVGRLSPRSANVDNMPVLDASMTYAEIAHTARRVLPGVRYRRHPSFRYSLLWTKP